MTLTNREKKLVAAIHFDEQICLSIKEQTGGKLKRLTAFTKDYKAIDADGLSIAMSRERVEELVSTLRPLLQSTEYEAYSTDAFDLAMKSEGPAIAVLKNVDEFDIIRIRRSNGGNYGVCLNDVIQRLKKWKKRCEFQIVGAGGSWVRIQFQTIPDNLCVFAEEIYEFCPDSVHQDTSMMGNAVKDFSFGTTEQMRSLRLFAVHCEFNVKTIPIGITAISRWLSESDTTGQQFPAGFYILEGCQRPSCRKNFDTQRHELRACCHPAGMKKLLGTRYRWCRCAQPPANGSSPSRTKTIRRAPPVFSVRKSFTALHDGTASCRRLGTLDVGNCPQLTALPPRLHISSWIEIAGSGLQRLPAHLQNVGIRWRGVLIDGTTAFFPEQLRAETVLKERNAERRRVMIERMGFDRFMGEAGANRLDADRDPGGPRELLRVPMQGDEDIVCLSVNCPSTGRHYLLRVPPTMKTCHQAAAWMAGFEDDKLYQPVKET